MPKLFVCAPHSHCNSNPVRHCDRVALEAATEIKNYDSGKNLCGWHVSDKLRTMRHDYNRPNTNKTEWRDSLRHLVKECSPDFVLEIHSFPGDHPMYQNLWKGADMAVFESDHNKSWVNLLVAEIKKRVSNEYHIEIVKPWHPVSITDDMTTIRTSNSNYKNLLHTLFEFNEDMPKERIPVLARAIYDAAISTIEQNGGRVSDAFGGRGAIQKNMSELKVYGAIFVIILLILIGVGQMVANRVFDAMFPQLRGWVDYETGGMHV